MKVSATITFDTYDAPDAVMNALALYFEHRAMHDFQYALDMRTIELEPTTLVYNVEVTSLEIVETGNRHNPSKIMAKITVLTSTFNTLDIGFVMGNFEKIFKMSLHQLFCILSHSGPMLATSADVSTYSGRM